MIEKCHRAKISVRMSLAIPSRVEHRLSFSGAKSIPSEESE